MIVSRSAAVLLLAGSFLYLWLRDLTWLKGLDESVVLMCGAPLFVWLASPWKLKESTWIPPSAGSLVVLASLIGLACDSSLMLVVTWTTLLAYWLRKNEPERSGRWRRVILLPLFGVPWLTHEGQAIGWYFRLSAAWVSEKLFSIGNLQVVRSGTQLWINGTGVDVEAACSGLNNLQLMMIAGTAAMACLTTAKFRIASQLFALTAIAWFSNTMRVILIAALACGVSPNFAEGWAHDAVGFLTAALAFGSVLLIMRYAEHSQLQRRGAECG